MKHIKTPVKYVSSFYGNNEYLEDANGYSLVRACSDVVDYECTMEEIAIAINTYDALLAACKACQALFNAEATFPDEDAQDYPIIQMLTTRGRAINAVQAAIVQATGETE